jgi:hypothetical protein
LGLPIVSPEHRIRREERILHMVVGLSPLPQGQYKFVNEAWRFERNDEGRRYQVGEKFEIFALFNVDKNGHIYLP